jgi:hypothetical protein
VRAGKLRVQRVPVNSAVPRTMRRKTNQLRRGAIKLMGAIAPWIAPTRHFCSSLGDARFSFVVKKIFVRMKNKIKFFFLSIFARISSLKPAGEDENRARVNKL